MKTSSTSLRLRLIALCILAFAAVVAMDRPAAADEALSRKTAAGREVLVRGFAEFGADCKLRHVQTVTVADAPLHGRIEQRPGVVTIGENWVGNKSCAGTKLDGVQVFYVPQDGFEGNDRFTIDVRYASHKTVHAKVDVMVGAMLADAKDRATP